MTRTECASYGPCYAGRRLESLRSMGYAVGADAGGRLEASVPSGFRREFTSQFRHA